MTPAMEAVKEFLQSIRKRHPSYERNSIEWDVRTRYNIKVDNGTPTEPKDRCRGIPID